MGQGMADVKLGADRPVSSDDGRLGKTGQQFGHPLRNRFGGGKTGRRGRFGAPQLGMRSCLGLDLEEFGGVGHRRIR